MRHWLTLILLRAVCWLNNWPLLALTSGVYVLGSRVRLTIEGGGGYGGSGKELAS